MGTRRPRRGEKQVTLRVHDPVSWEFETKAFVKEVDELCRKYYRKAFDWPLESTEFRIAHATFPGASLLPALERLDRVVWGWQFIRINEVALEKSLALHNKSARPENELCLCAEKGTGCPPIRRTIKIVRLSGEAMELRRSARLRHLRAENATKKPDEQLPEEVNDGIISGVPMVPFDELPFFCESEAAIPREVEDCVLAPVRQVVTSPQHEEIPIVIDLPPAGDVVTVTSRRATRGSKRKFVPNLAVSIHRRGRKLASMVTSLEEQEKRKKAVDGLIEMMVGPENKMDEEVAGTTSRDVFGIRQREEASRLRVSLLTASGATASTVASTGVTNLVPGLTDELKEGLRKAEQLAPTLVCNAPWGAPNTATITSQAAHGQPFIYTPGNEGWVPNWAPWDPANYAGVTGFVNTMLPSWSSNVYAPTNIINHHLFSNSAVITPEDLRARYPGVAIVGDIPTMPYRRAPLLPLDSGLISNPGSPQVQSSTISSVGGSGIFTNESVEAAIARENLTEVKLEYDPLKIEIDSPERVDAYEGEEDASCLVSLLCATSSTIWDAPPVSAEREKDGGRRSADPTPAAPPTTPHEFEDVYNIPLPQEERIRQLARSGQMSGRQRCR